jgi:hypothetical protein
VLSQACLHVPEICPALTLMADYHNFPKIDNGQFQIKNQEESIGQVKQGNGLIFKNIDWNLEVCCFNGQNTKEYLMGK